jgi:hypothetical protein
VISASRENWFYEQKRLVSVDKAGSMNRKKATNLLPFNTSLNLKVGCLHPVACTRSGSGFPSNATMVIRPKHVPVTE